MSREHTHRWQVSVWETDPGCVIECECGAQVRVARTGAGLRSEVLMDGGQTFTADDAEWVLALAMMVFGSS